VEAIFETIRQELDLLFIQHDNYGYYKTSVIDAIDDDFQVFKWLACSGQILSQITTLSPLNS
jgi:hypothetical protein